MKTIALLRLVLAPLSAGALITGLSAQTAPASALAQPAAAAAVSGTISNAATRKLLDEIGRAS
jgi:hypothetical protein